MCSFLITNIFSSSAFANECSNEMIHEVGGYNISPRKTEVLAGRYFTRFTVNLGKNETIAKIGRLISKVNPRPRGSNSPGELAAKIYSVGEAYGVDPILFTAKIWQESGSFNVDVVAPGGDTGLTQMTGSGLNEVREQHKKINSSNRAEKNVGLTLANLANNHLKNNNNTNQWVNWVITKSNNQQKATLVQNVDYALMAGASLLKIYLSIKNGSYSEAIKQYNGGGTRGYYGMVMDREAKVQKSSSICENSQVIEDTLAAACQVVGTDNECNALVNEVLGNKAKEYEI